MVKFFCSERPSCFLRFPPNSFRLFFRRIGGLSSFKRSVLWDGGVICHHGLRCLIPRSLVLLAIPQMGYEHFEVLQDWKQATRESRVRRKDEFSCCGRERGWETAMRVEKVMVPSQGKEIFLTSYRTEEGRKAVWCGTFLKFPRGVRAGVNRDWSE